MGLVRGVETERTGAKARRCRPRRSDVTQLLGQISDLVDIGLRLQYRDAHNLAARIHVGGSPACAVGTTRCTTQVQASGVNCALDSCILCTAQLQQIGVNCAMNSA